jgi:hypothetical protein
MLGHTFSNCWKELGCLLSISVYDLRSCTLVFAGGAPPWNNTEDGEMIRSASWCAVSLIGSWTGVCCVCDCALLVDCEDVFEDTEVRCGMPDVEREDMLRVTRGAGPEK